MILFLSVRQPHVLDIDLGIHPPAPESVKYVPEWFPGAGFQKEASEARKIVKDFVNIPFQFTLDQMVFQNSDDSRQ